MSESKVSLVIRFDPTAERKVTKEEEEYRRNEYPNEQKFLKRKSIECSSCGREVRKKIVHDNELYIHPALEVIICFKCEDFYNDGEFSVDEDGSDKYCRWCGQGGNLYCCSFCSVAICAVCVKRNLPRKYDREIERDDWRCFVCDPKPIWSFRALCHAAKQYVENHKPSKTSKRSRTIHESDSESDDGLKLERKKKSKIDVTSKEENELQEDFEDSKSSRLTKKKSKVSKTYDQATESDESPPRARTKRGLKTLIGRPPSPSRIQKTDNSDESSNTSSSTRTLRNRPSRNRRHRNVDSDESSSASSSLRRSSRKKSLTRNADSDDSKFASPSKKRSHTKKIDMESRNICSSPSADSETNRCRSGTVSSCQSQNLVKLALIDSMKDFRKFVKILTKNQNSFEEKYLKSKSRDPDFWLKAKDRYLLFIENAVESVLGFQNSFQKCIETLEKDEKLMNGDKIPESELNGDKTSDRGRKSENDVNSVQDVEMTETQETTKITDADTEMEIQKNQNLEEMSTECADATQEQMKEITAEPVLKKIEKEGDTPDLNPDKLPVSCSERMKTTCCSVNKPEKKDVCEGLASESMDTLEENDDVPEKDEINSESKNTETVDRTNDLQFKNCEVRLSKISKPCYSADSDPLSDEQGNKESESQSVTFEIDLGDNVETA